jgi:GntR family transcriptional regulator / MocR family aminotransferase
MSPALPDDRDEASAGRDLLLEIDLRRGHLRRNLHAGLRTAIHAGRLTAGTRLPSSRRLATDLGVSRGVTADTYDQLAAEGYLTIEPRRAPVVAGVAMARPAAEEPGPTVWRTDFVATTPDVELFPRRAWLRACERALRSAPNAALDYGDHRGRIELRRALADYLARVRGVRVDPGRIVVTQGFTQALDLVCRVLAARGAESIAIESPSLVEERPTIQASGLRLEPCPVDAHGIRTDDLSRRSPAGVLVTPAHQFPTGAVLAPARRTELVTWATRVDALIIEDDYDAEFRYDRTAVGALQGLDPQRVVHVGTASKTLAPGVRLGWMSLPAQLVDEIRAAKAAADSGSPSMDQLALAEMLASGEYDRHVARARQVYRRRRDRLVESLGRRLPALRVEGAAAGLHVVLRLPQHVDDSAVTSAAAEAGVGVRALSAMSLLPGGAPGLLLGYGRLATDAIDAAVASLAAVIGPAIGRRATA